MNRFLCAAMLDVQQVHHCHGTGFRALPKQGQQSVSGGPLELLTRSALGQCPGQRVFDALLALLDQIAIVSAGDAVHLDLNIAATAFLRPETAAAMAAKP